jgi:hypothetical protein
MRRFIIVILMIGSFLLGYQTSLTSQQHKLELPWGYLEAGTNEVSVISTVEDPPKIRLAAAKGLSYGALSFNRLRSDGRQVETILIQGKQDERWRHVPRSDWKSLASEFTIHINDGSGDHDGAMKLVFHLTSTGIYTPWTGRIGS